jgi:NAD(P)-dependent dehydrogenase (short-subunit alcohol dehydrogenase family)
MESKDVVALVTGGASGLGEATVIELAKKNAKVAIIDIEKARGEKLASDLGSNVIFTEADVTSGDALARAINKALEVFGKINVAVNCAGIATPGKILGKKGPMSLDYFTRVLQINLIGTLNTIRLAVEQMVKNEANADGEKGVIINTASIAAWDGQVGQAAYCASKGGIVGMTLPIARECADYGIRVATIAPGIFETPLMAGLPQPVIQEMIKTIPFPKRLGKPVEYARFVLHMIENSMFNGCCVRFDGALRMPPK